MYHHQADMSVACSRNRKKAGANVQRQRGGVGAYEKLLVMFRGLFSF